MQTISPPLTVNKSVSHLRYLDGLRGLAALYVVFHHAYMEVIGGRLGVSLPLWADYSTRWLGWGQSAVDVFIVLSGYCLMLPVARAGGMLKGGAVAYMKRRARRILPPYYAALVIVLLVIALVPGMNAAHGLRWDTALPALKPSVIVPHLLLLHTLRPWWTYAIDPPMWSVAVEWQIYFLFPLLLLPLWRRFGAGMTVTAAFVVGLLPLVTPLRSFVVCPWFLGLFALGMAAAGINFGGVGTRLSPALTGWLVRRSALFSGLSGLLFATVMVTQLPFLQSRSYITDALVGLTTALLLVFCSDVIGRETEPHPPLLHLLESPGAVRLGVFSYSLYLVHFPILSGLHLALLPFRLPSIVLLGILEAVGTAISLAVAYGFHLLFERRFMPGSSRTERAAETAAVVSPAP